MQNQIRCFKLKKINHCFKIIVNTFKTIFEIVKYDIFQLNQFNNAT